MEAYLKRSMKFLVAGLMVTASAPAFADPVVGPYVALGVGGIAPLNNHTGTAAGRTSYRIGYLGDLAAGYSLGNGFRPELDVGYGSSRLGDTDGFGKVGGKLTKLTYTANIFYDFDRLNWPVTPYVGVGAGGTRIHGGSFGSGTGVEITGFRPSVQGIVGVSYPITPQIRINLDYRYLETFNARFAADNAGVISTGHGNIGENQLLLSVRYTFGQPPAPPMQTEQTAQTTVEAPAPAPAPEPQRAFQVFFDFDKSAITSDAAAIIEKAAETVKAGHLATINVIGHTDTMGSSRYNQKLSERRAAAVKAQLAADGVEETDIETQGVGKTGLLVQTPDGVREPQNRRAEITLQ
jgi:outer membrane protein OmpA-like peptidoglycan-associated protein